MKLLLAIAGLLVTSFGAHAQVLDVSKIKRGAVEYVSPDKLKKFPVPILEYLSDKAEHDRLKEKIAEKIIYPMLCESTEPIAVVTVDFCPEIIVIGAESKRGCKDENKGKLVLQVSIRRQGGSGFTSFIEWDKEVGIDEDAYLTLFQDGYDDYVPKRKCKKEEKKRISSDTAPNKSLKVTAR